MGDPIFTILTRRRPFLKLSLLASGTAALWSLQANAQAPFKVDPIEDLSKKAKPAHVAAEPAIYILVFSTTGCPYCEIIRRSHLPNIPKRVHGKKIVLQELLFDRSSPMVDFDGQATTYRDFARRLGVRLSPTLMAFDEKGQLLAEPLIGVANFDFYSFYLEQLVSKAVQKST
jgi:thioredoxin-related protein